MRLTLSGRNRGGADVAAALGGEVVLAAPRRDELADEFFALAVVDRCVDVVDAGVEDGIQDGFGLRGSYVTAAGSAADFHCAESELGDVESGASEGCRGEGAGHGMGFLVLVGVGSWRAGAVVGRVEMVTEKASTRDPHPNRLSSAPGARDGLGSQSATRAREGTELAAAEPSSNTALLLRRSSPHRGVLRNRSSSRGPRRFSGKWQAPARGLRPGGRLS